MLYFLAIFLPNVVRWEHFFIMKKEKKMRLGVAVYIWELFISKLLKTDH